MTDPHLAAMREHLTDERQDETGYLIWEAPSQLAALTDQEVVRLYRKTARENLHPPSRQVELELMGRFTVALREFKEASDIASSRLLLATRVLIVLTVAIVGLTVALVFHG